ncbi:MAG: dehydrogenase E1 component subunit alpha/beta [Sphaerochaetaceae bacterium]
MVFSKQESEHVLMGMECSRHFEERIDSYFKQKAMYGTTHLSIGQEASQAGLAMALSCDDWIVPTHRCHGYTILRGTDMQKMFSEMFGSAQGICKGLGGSMHMTDKQHCNAGSSAVVGSGVPLALGLGFAMKRQGKKSISVAIFGDGATSRGTVHECMNLASVWDVPLLFYCENNGYGMSAPVQDAVATDNIARRAEGYRMQWKSCDGNDVEAVYLACKEAVEYIRRNQKPYFLEVKTYRQNGHSKSDRCEYRTREEEETWKKRDPIVLFEEALLKESVFTKEELVSIIQGADTKVDEAASAAEKTRGQSLALDEAMKYVYAQEDSQPVDNTPILHKGSYRQAIHEALDEEMERSKEVMLIGEDIAKYGGCFHVSGDLYLKHPGQVLETPVCEESFTGLAVGAALLGQRCVVEIMYGDFCTLASDPIINHAAKIHFMSAGQLSCPMVLRAPMGSGTGHGSQHTQSLEGMFASVPGLIVVAPSCPKDAKGLLKSAIRSNNPVLYFEHKMLYGCEGDIADENYVMPLGKADIKKEGSQVSLVCYSHATQTCLAAAQLLSRQGIDCEVVDLCSLRPMDTLTILQSVRKTGRVIVVQNSPAFGSYGTAIVSSICCDPPTLSLLKVHPVLLGGKECPIPFTSELEKEMIPSVDDVINAVVSII